MRVRNRHNDVVTDHELVSAAGERAREVQRAQGVDEFAAGDRSPSRPSASSTYRLIIGDRSYRTTPRVSGLFPSRVPEHPDDGRLAVQSRRDSASGCPCGHHGRLRFGPASSRLCVALVSLERRAGKWTPSLWHPFSPLPQAFDVSLFRHCPRPFARRMPHACLSRARGISRATPNTVSCTVLSTRTWTPFWTPRLQASKALAYRHLSSRSSGTFSPAVCWRTASLVCGAGSARSSVSRRSRARAAASAPAAEGGA